MVDQGRMIANSAWNMKQDVWRSPSNFRIETHGFPTDIDSQVDNLMSTWFKVKKNSGFTWILADEVLRATWTVEKWQENNDTKPPEVKFIEVPVAVIPPSDKDDTPTIQDELDEEMVAARFEVDPEFHRRVMQRVKRASAADNKHDL